MHIAICDDNVADRKQLERLLGRESNQFAAEGSALYVDAFGNAEALLANPMQYDVFFIDVCHTNNVSSLSIAQKLRAKGVTVPFVLCCGDVNYREQDFEEGTLFIDKAIRVADLRAIIEQVKDLDAHAESMIELREKTGTVYLHERDFAYAYEKGFYTYVIQADGTLRELRSSAISFYEENESAHPSIILASSKVVLNCRYIREFVFPHTAVMTDGAKYHIQHSFWAYVQQMQKDYYRA